MKGTPYQARRGEDTSRSIARHARLSDNLATLEGQWPFMRANHVARFTDGQIAWAAWTAYQPAVPLTFAGITFAGAGFVLGDLGISLLLGLLSMPFRRRRSA